MVVELPKRGVEQRRLGGGSGQGARAHRSILAGGEGAMQPVPGRSPVTALLLLASAEGEEVAIGAIVGAPFMLGTVAMLLIAGSALVFAKRRTSGRELQSDHRAVRRDLGFFLPCFAGGIALGLVDSKPLHIAGIAALVIAYVIYAARTVKKGGEADDEAELKPLYFDPSKNDPPRTFQISLQALVGLALIVGGAELFVEEIKKVSESVGLSALVLSLVLAPLATELPEKLNSVIWMRQGKDTLAVGNVTGAMAFRSTIPVAFGLAVTDWELDKFAVAAGVLGLAGGALALWRLRVGHVSPLAAVAWAALFGALVVFVGVGS